MSSVLSELASFPRLKRSVLLCLRCVQYGRLSVCATKSVLFSTIVAIGHRAWDDLVLLRFA
jgi:hypothetical protein